jgi:flagellin-specific chaperone FliS
MILSRLVTNMWGTKNELDKIFDIIGLKGLLHIDEGRYLNPYLDDIYDLCYWSLDFVSSTSCCINLLQQWNQHMKKENKTFMKL